MELHNKRGRGESGPNPLSYTDIISWKELLGVEIYPHEVKIMMEMDNIYMELVGREMEKAFKKRK